MPRLGAATAAPGRPAPRAARSEHDQRAPDPGLPADDEALREQDGRRDAAGERRAVRRHRGRRRRLPREPQRGAALHRGGDARGRRRVRGARGDDGRLDDGAARQLPDDGRAAAGAAESARVVPGAGAAGDALPVPGPVLRLLHPVAQEPARRRRLRRQVQRDGGPVVPQAAPRRLRRVLQHRPELRRRLRGRRHLRRAPGRGHPQRPGPRAQPRERHAPRQPPHHVRRALHLGVLRDRERFRQLRVPLLRARPRHGPGGQGAAARGRGRLWLLPQGVHVFNLSWHRSEQVECC